MIMVLILIAVSAVSEEVVLNLSPQDMSTVHGYASAPFNRCWVTVLVVFSVPQKVHDLVNIKIIDCFV